MYDLLMQGPPCYPELAAALVRQGLTQSDLAEAVGIAQGTVSGIIRGTIRPSAALRQRIADHLGENVEQLFTLHPDIERLVQSAVEQGFGRHVTDPTVLKKVATIVRAAKATPRS